MTIDFDKIDSEIEELMKGTDFNLSEDYDSEPVLRKAATALTSLDKDFDGTPIVGTKAKSSPRKVVELKQKKEKKHPNLGRPQNKTITVSNYKTPEEKLGLIFSVIYAQFTQEQIKRLFDEKKLELVLIDNDGYSICKRIRFYVGLPKADAHTRDIAKGRYNAYERKGSFPIAELLIYLKTQI